MISIIIPVFNEEKTIPNQLRYLKGCIKHYDAEIIVVDGQSRDNTFSTVKQAGVKCLKSKKKGRAVQMNLGARHAKGDILYFVHADSRPPATFITDIKKSIDEGFETGCYRFRFNSDHPLLKVNSFFTRFDRLMCRGGDQTLFITRSLFKKSGGFREDYLIMEDFEFIKRIRKMSDFKIIPKDTIVSARKYHDNNYLKVNFVNLVIFILFFLGASQQTMVHAYKNLIVNTKFG